MVPWLSTRICSNQRWLLSSPSPLALALVVSCCEFNSVALAATNSAPSTSVAATASSETGLSAQRPIDLFLVGEIPNDFASRLASWLPPEIPLHSHQLSASQLRASLPTSDSKSLTIWIIRSEATAIRVYYAAPIEGEESLYFISDIAITADFDEFSQESLSEEIHSSILALRQQGNIGQSAESWTQSLAVAGDHAAKFESSINRSHEHLPEETVAAATAPSSASNDASNETSQSESELQLLFNLGFEIQYRNPEPLGAGPTLGVNVQWQRDKWQLGAYLGARYFPLKQSTLVEAEPPTTPQIILNMESIGLRGGVSLYRQLVPSYFSLGSLLYLAADYQQWRLSLPDSANTSNSSNWLGSLGFELQARTLFIEDILGLQLTAGLEVPFDRNRYYITTPINPSAPQLLGESPLVQWRGSLSLLIKY